METVLGMTDLQIKFFTAIGQIAVACIVGYIAWQQWQTARKKLKADLFDRRLSSYRELKSKVASIIDGAMSDNEPEALLTEVWEIERLGIEMAWSFAPNVGISVESVREAAIDVVKARIDYCEAEGGNERRRVKRMLYEAQVDLQTNLQRVTAEITHLMQLGH